ncbi:MAG: hypothetical protein M0P71_17225 [Melioribacteraceae bacterium]|jgi:uncharacterized protein (UPF0254 family)|nr:hypothetical protein [Melioribacteraceae bacterium]
MRKFIFLIILLSFLSCERTIPAKYKVGDIVCMKLDGRKGIISFVHNNVDAWADDNTPQFWYMVNFANDKKSEIQIAIGGSTGIGHGGNATTNNSLYEEKIVREWELSECKKEIQ